MTRRDILLGSIILILLITTFFSSKESLNKNDIIDTISDENDSLKIQLNNLNDSINNLSSSLVKTKTDKFELVYNRFHHFNRNINDVTVNKFIEVTDEFNLNESDRLFDVCISQICVESGAKQKTKTGEVLESSGNAIGITQIVPTTAHHYLRNILSKEDFKIFKDLGATDFSFIKKQPRYSMNSNERGVIKKWLSNETNNIILWGYIMRYNLNRNHSNIPNTLLAYNQGNGFLHDYIKDGYHPRNHIYVLMVEDTIKKLNGTII